MYRSDPRRLFAPLTDFLSVTGHGVIFRLCARSGDLF